MLFASEDILRWCNPSGMEKCMKGREVQGLYYLVVFCSFRSCIFQEHELSREELCFLLYSDHLPAVCSCFQTWSDSTEQLSLTCQAGEENSLKSRLRIWKCHTAQLMNFHSHVEQRIVWDVTSLSSMVISELSWLKGWKRSENRHVLPLQPSQSMTAVQYI